MTYILTHAGRQHSLLPPLSVSTQSATTQPSLAEIGWSLAHINRFTGHADRAYSVAEHSLLVADIAADRGASARGQLCALMHDAHECIVGDVATPIKHLLGTVWESLEDYHQSALLDSLNLLWDSKTTYAQIIKDADRIALATERRDLLQFDPIRHEPWTNIDGSYEPWAEVYLMCERRTQKTPEQWAAEFEDRARALLVADQRAGSRRICNASIKAPYSAGDGCQPVNIRAGGMDAFGKQSLGIS